MPKGKLKNVAFFKGKGPEPWTGLQTEKCQGETGRRKGRQMEKAKIVVDLGWGPGDFGG